MKPYRLTAAIALMAGGAFAYAQSPKTDRHNLDSSQSLTVAFIADQGSGKAARAVLQLIKAEGAKLVLHQGDFDYGDDPDRWDNMITTALGDNFPYFAAIGNHDVKRWYGPNGYQAMLQARLKKISGARCDGEIGVKVACSYRGLFFIQSGIGTMPNTNDDPGHLTFIRKQLAQTNAIWRICSWHKNQDAMQVGKKRDEVGWGAYEACRKGGAIIATGHNHAYARTYSIRNFETQSIASTSGTLEIEEGKSFAFVSGLGGRSFHKQKQSAPWWASIYTSNKGAKFGALFCTFFIEDMQNRARCYFKDIAGNIPDRFELISNNKTR